MLQLRQNPHLPQLLHLRLLLTVGRLLGRRLRALGAYGLQPGDSSTPLVCIGGASLNGDATQTAHPTMTGVFQAYYEEDLLQNESASRISWIGSLQLCLFIAGTIVVGPMYDVGLLQPLLLVGSFLTVFGMMMTSICKQYWEFMLAQGVCMGLGMTCLFVPSIALIPTYFVKKRGLAAGISATGSSIGKCHWI